MTMKIISCSPNDNHDFICNYFIFTIMIFCLLFITEFPRGLVDLLRKTQSIGSEKNKQIRKI